MPKETVEFFSQRDLSTKDTTSDPFMAQCNCTLKYYDKETFEDFKKKHEETPGHELKVISP